MEKGMIKVENINSPIPYNWTHGWGLKRSQPKVNLLLKAALEGKAGEMECLFEQGASLKQTDEKTFETVVYLMADNYPVMESFVRHGMSRIGHDIDVNGNNGCNNSKCLTTNGYNIGVTARACDLKAYDVMALLCEHGFDDFYCHSPAWSDFPEYYDKYIFKKGIEPAIRIMLEHGYVFSNLYGNMNWAYEEYVLNRAQVKRKSCGLDPMKFRTAEPGMGKLEDVPWIFGRKEALYRNERRREDHADRVRALREFRAAYGMEKVADREAKRDAFSSLVGQAMMDIAKKNS